MTSPYSAAHWHAPVATTGLWALAAAAAVFWGLRLAAPPEPVAAAATMPRAAVSADADAVARLLGVVSGADAAPAAPRRPAALRCRAWWRIRSTRAPP